MRVAGMIAAVFVLIAVWLGFRFLHETVGIDRWLITQVIVPVFLGVALLCAGLIFLGRWSVRRLIEADEDARRRGEAKAPRDERTASDPRGKHG